MAQRRHELGCRAPHTSALPYVEVDGTQIAANWTSLISGTLDNPLNLTETGSAVSFAVWTGSFGDGSSTTDNCNSWTSASAALDVAAVGSPVSSNGGWTFTATSACNALRGLYCFEQ